MHPLHLTKVAFGCADADYLRDRLIARAADGETYIDTRYRPTRHTELVGGSLFWIIKHQLVARSRIVRFDADEGGRCLIRLDALLVPVVAHGRRAHQGWRYLDGASAPRDVGGEGAEGLGEMPSRLLGELVALALV